MWLDYEAVLLPDSKAVVDKVWEKYKDFSGNQPHYPDPPGGHSVA